MFRRPSGPGLGYPRFARKSLAQRAMPLPRPPDGTHGYHHNPRGCDGILRAWGGKAHRLIKNVSLHAFLNMSNSRLLIWHSNSLIWAGKDSAPCARLAASGGSLRFGSATRPRNLSYSSRFLSRAHSNPSTATIVILYNMGREGFEPPKLAQQIYSLPPLTTWVPARNSPVVPDDFAGNPYMELARGFEPPTC